MADNKVPSFADLLDKEIADREAWIEPKVLTKSGLLLLGGLPKTFKSFFALELARALTTCATPFDCEIFSVPRSAKVLMIEAEIGERGYQERGGRVFAGVDRALWEERFDFVSKDTTGFSVPDMILNTPEGFNLLEKVVTASKPDILILDPVGKMTSLDENDNGEVGKMFNRFDRLIKKHADRGMSIIINHHMKKPPSEKSMHDPLDPLNFRGSSRYYADPDSLVTIYRHTGHFYSKRGQQAGKVSTRFTLRHGPQFEDLLMMFNADDDNRVKFVAKIMPDEPPKLETRPAPKKKEETVESLKGTQLSFQPATRKI